MILCHPRARRGSWPETRQVRLLSKFASPPRQVLGRQEHLSQSRPRDVGQDACGLGVLAGSWIALYAFQPDSWKFVALYLLGGLAQTFLAERIAHDSNHNAISSVPSVNKTLNYAFDVCGINSYMWRILHHRGHHSCINVHGEDDALMGRGILRFSPHEPYKPIQKFQHIYALFMYALFSLFVFVETLSAFSFPPAYLERMTSVAGYIISLQGRRSISPTCSYCRWWCWADRRCCECGVCTGSSDRRFDRGAVVFQTTHTVDSTYASLLTEANLTTACFTSSHFCGYATNASLVGAACGRAQPPHRPSFVPFVYPYPLRPADSDCRKFLEGNLACPIGNIPP